MGALWVAAISVAIIGVSAQSVSDPAALIQEADRLAWLRVWGAAEPLFAQAEKQFSANGDQRNVLYAQINVPRGQLPRLPVPAVSACLAEYFEHPLVQSDDRLRLRVLVIKMETRVMRMPSPAAPRARSVVRAGSPCPGQRTPPSQFRLSSSIDSSTGSTSGSRGCALRPFSNPLFRASGITWVEPPQ